MRMSGGTLAGLAVAVGILFLGAPRAMARKSSLSTPRLSGTYAFRLEKICQPDFYGTEVQDSTDNDYFDFQFEFPGSFQKEIGVVTFSPKTAAINGSALKVKGDLLTQDLSNLPYNGGVTNNTFTQISDTISGTYSTTSSTFTITDSSNNTTTFQAVYGAYANTTAHVVFFQSVFTSNGFSCEQSGELQFK